MPAFAGYFGQKTILPLTYYVPSGQHFKVLGSHDIVAKLQVVM